MDEDRTDGEEDQTGIISMLERPGGQQATGGKGGGGPPLFFAPNTISIAVGTSSHFVVCTP
jgi:hypothetical protein